MIPKYSFGTDDITFCGNDCGNDHCDRNPINIIDRTIPHSFSDFMGIEPFCKGYVEKVKCKECKHLMFSDCYGECGIGNRGIVSPHDYCKDGKRKDNT